MDNMEVDYKEKAKKIIKMANLFSEKLKNKVIPHEKTEEEELIESIKQAHWDWQSKEVYFQTVSDPDLVDHAIYEMEASRIKYIYLLKKLREKGIILNK